MAKTNKLLINFRNSSTHHLLIEGERERERYKSTTTPSQFVQPQTLAKIISAGFADKAE